MPKLHLKRTPEEDALRRLRKEAKRKSKHKHKHKHKHSDDEPGMGDLPPRKRSRHSCEGERKWASSDKSEQHGPQPVPSSSRSTRPSDRYKLDQDELGAEMDEMLFREKLFDAFADDERLDSLEARLNEFAHVPNRWRASQTRVQGNISQDADWLKMNPQEMDDEDYVEWIRMGMYRKTHANEYEEQQRQKAACAARLAQETLRKEETARLEKVAEDERKRKKDERDARRWEHAMETYHIKWKAFLVNSGGANSPELLGFDDVPWPIMRTSRERPSGRRPETVSVSLDDLTLGAISAFLLPTGSRGEEKSRKDVLRDTYLKFHPDKFEGRYMKLMREDEQEKIRAGIGQVVRVLNRLMDGST